MAQADPRRGTRNRASRPAGHRSDARGSDATRRIERWPATRSSIAGRITDRDAFWREEAALIDWQTPFTAVLDYSKPPFAKWFVGGRTNLCHNAVDRHLAARGDQKALVYISTETGETKTYTYPRARTPK